MPRDKQYTPEEVESKFDDYLEYCAGVTKEHATSSGKVVQVSESRIPTMGGFCNYIRVTDETINNYRKGEGYEAYFGIIKSIDNYLYNVKKDAVVNGDGNTTGLIFYLKAKKGWTEKQVQEIQHKGDGIRVEVVETKKKEDE